MRAPLIKLCALIAVLFWPLELLSQNIKIDSLIAVIKTEKEDTNKVRTLDNLGRTYFFLSKYKQADSAGQLELALSEKLNYKQGIADACLGLGNTLFNKGVYAEAVNYYNRCLKVAEEIGNKQTIGRACSNLGNISYMQANYPDALGNYLKALNINKVINDKKGMANAYTNIGNIYMVEGDYPEALKNQLEALKIKQDINDKRGVGNSYGNIGSIYYSLNNFNDALKNHLLSAEACNASKNKVGEANAYINMGNDYLALGNYAKALESEQKSLAIDNEIQNIHGITLAYENIGRVYSAQHNQTKAIESFLFALKKAKESGDKYAISIAYEDMGYSLTQLNKFTESKAYLDSALTLSTQIADKTNIRDSYLYKTKLDSALGDYKTAFADYKNYMAFQDSLLNEGNTRKIVAEQLNYEFDKKQEAEKAEQDKKDIISEEKLGRQKLMTWSAIGGSLLALGLIGLLFNRARLKQKNIYQQQLNQKQKEQANAVMDTQEQERKRIAEDLHDSLGYLLSTVKLNLQAAGEQKENIENSIKLINQASTEIRNITFNLMPRTLEEEGLIPALRELAARTATANSAKINLDLHDVEGLTIQKQTQFTIYRIIQEAVNNVFKYAEAKEINIQLIKLDDQLTIMLEDDGKGFNVEEVKKGRGLKNMMSRSEWLNGKMEIDSGNGQGTTIILEIPV